MATPQPRHIWELLSDQTFGSPLTSGERRRLQAHKRRRDRQRQQFAEHLERDGVESEYWNWVDFGVDHEELLWDAIEQLDTRPVDAIRPRLRFYLSLVFLLLDQPDRLAAVRREDAQRGGVRSAATRREILRLVSTQTSAAITEKKSRKPDMTKRAAVLAHLAETDPTWLTLTEPERKRRVDARLRRVRRVAKEK